MPPLQHRICSRARTSGGVLSYPLERVYEEVAFIAYHFHWSQDEILSLEHARRQTWVTEINKINQKIL